MQLRAAGWKPRPFVKAFLIFLILVFTVALLYVAVAPTPSIARDQGAYAYGTAAPACLLLFLWRLMGYRPKRSLAGSFSLAVFDLLAYISVLGIILWAFILPVIHQLPATTIIDMFYSPNLPIGIYSIVLGMGMLVLIRVLFVPFTHPPSEKLYGEIETSLRRLNESVSQMGQKLEGAGGKMDPALVEKVTSMVGELSAVRRELTSIKGSGGVSPGGQNVSGFRVMAPSQAGVREAPREVVAVIRNETQSQAQRRTESGVAVPDSMVDNPWNSVLSKRKAVKAPSKKPES